MDPEIYKAAQNTKEKHLGSGIGTGRGRSRARKNGADGKSMALRGEEQRKEGG